MPKPTLRYDKMVEDALRGVVREALAQVVERGLPGSHHFYITFRTVHPGVTMPDFLRAQYPQEMTIVLQFQFWGLEVDDEAFSVTLSFHSQHQRLTVPLAAITAFADPSVKFALEFQSGESVAPVREVGGPAELLSAPEPTRLDPPRPDAETPAPDKPAAVVRLDAFRKK